MLKLEITAYSSQLQDASQEDSIYDARSESGHRRRTKTVAEMHCCTLDSPRTFRFLGVRVVNIYDVDNKTYLIKFSKYEIMR